MARKPNKKYWIKRSEKKVLKNRKVGKSGQKMKENVQRSKGAVHEKDRKYW
jgi:hypothetical protein